MSRRTLDIPNGRGVSNPSGTENCGDGGRLRACVAAASAFPLSPWLPQRERATRNRPALKKRSDGSLKSGQYEPDATLNA